MNTFLSKLLIQVIDKHAARYFCGETSFDEAIDAAYEEFNVLFEYEECQEKLKAYYDNFVEVDKVCEKHERLFDNNL